MRIAVSPPTSALHLLPLTGLQLCLAEYVLSNYEYRDVYAKLPPSETVILDTMVHERKGEGQAMSYGDLMDAHAAIKAEIIVVPDDDHDPRATLARLKEWAPKIHETYPWVEVMGVVPKASNIDLWVQNLRNTIPLVDCIGLPMEVEALFPEGGRIAALAICDKLLPSIKKIHLLGIRQDLTEIRIAAGYRRLLGADSARPITLALQGVDWRDVDNGSRLPGKQPDYFDTPIQIIREHEELIQCNIQYLLEQAQDKSLAPI